ncbi:hypothetical protein CLOM_g276 [Closterium sp. NIES-68]|nr:hypothetical protein CLOM_g276 [Closterium sp. NIES-68]GJP84904.1 hypothetical protein CLOP_g14950 [Closterium sp. NIES-67]
MAFIASGVNGINGSVSSGLRSASGSSSGNQLRSSFLVARLMITPCDDSEYRTRQRRGGGGGGGGGGLSCPPFAPRRPSSFEARPHRPPEIVTLASGRHQALASSRHETFSSFDDMIRSSDLVLVEFYATWCGPCKHMAGVLQSLSHRLLDSVKIVKIDTEKYPKLASRHAITALPTVVIFRHGQPVDRIEGILPPEELILRLSSLLASSHTH